MVSSAAIGLLLGLTVDLLVIINIDFAYYYLGPGLIKFLLFILFQGCTLFFAGCSHIEALASEYWNVICYLTTPLLWIVLSSAIISSKESWFTIILLFILFFGFPAMVMQSLLSLR